MTARNTLSLVVVTLSSLAIARCGSDEDGGDATGSGGGAGTGGDGSGTTLPALCQFFTADLAAQLTTGTLDGAGEDAMVSNGRSCTYPVAGATPPLVIGTLNTSDGDAAGYISRCMNMGGMVVDGVGTWACMRAGNNFSAGDDTWEVGFGGDVGDVEVYRTVGNALLAKLP